jgi:hypothetical protein
LQIADFLLGARKLLVEAFENNCSSCHHQVSGQGSAR